MTFIGGTHEQLVKSKLFFPYIFNLEIIFYEFSDPTENTRCFTFDVSLYFCFSITEEKGRMAEWQKPDSLVLS